MIPQTAAPPPGTGGVPREMDCSSGFANSTRTFNETKLAVSKMPFFATAPFSHNTTRSDCITGLGVLTAGRDRQQPNMRFRAPLDCRF